MKGRGIISLLALCTMAFVSSAHAADYPTKPITLMVAYPAGGETDIGGSDRRVHRGKGPGAADHRGQQRRRRWTDRMDGNGPAEGRRLYHRLCQPCRPSTASSWTRRRKATFTLDNFVPIINQVVDPVCFYVKPESPYKTFKDVLEDARKRPGKITVTTTGILSNEHLGILMLEDAARVKFRIVHFDGSAQILTALMGGQIDVGSIT